MWYEASFKTTLTPAVLVGARNDVSLVDIQTTPFRYFRTCLWSYPLLPAPIVAMGKWTSFSLLFYSALSHCTGQAAGNMLLNI